MAARLRRLSRGAPFSRSRARRRRGEAPGRDPAGQLLQAGHIAPTQVEALATDGMAAVGTVPYQHQGALGQGPGQAKGHRIGPWLVQQGFRLQLVGEGAG